LDDHPGFVRESTRGTLFLDEIADLPLTTQTTLLRVLQENEVVPVGSCRPESVDLRVVAATNKNIEGMVQSGDFRNDLFGRLLGFSIELPPLRRRPEDLGMLLSRLLQKLVPTPDAVTFSPAAGVALLAYPWPLNVRELERCLATAAVLAGSEAIGLSHLPRAIREYRSREPSSLLATEVAAAPAGNVSPRRGRPRTLTLKDHERRTLLLSLLSVHRGNVAAVSAAVGKARAQVHRWLRRYEIDASQFRIGK
jgi:DNA-binding NtrC family response regulator